MKIISNILFGVGAAIGALGLYLIISTNLSLPPGVCPIDNNRPLLFVAIGILVISLLLSFAADRYKKRLDAGSEKDGASNTDKGGDEN